MTEEGISILLSPVQRENTEFPIEFTEEGILISVSFSHPEKTPLSIVFTEFGISIFYKFSQFLKIETFKFSIFDGNFTSFKLMQFINT